MIGLFGRLRLIVEVELVEAVGKSQQHKTVDEKKLEDVQQHAAERNLQWAQVRVGSEQRDETQRAEDVGNGEESLCDERRVPHLPLHTRTRAIVLMEREDM